MEPEAPKKQQLSVEDVRQCTDVIEKILADYSLWADLPADDKTALLVAAGRLTRPNKHEIRSRNHLYRRHQKRVKALADRESRGLTGIRVARQDAVFTAPSQVLNLPSSVGEVPELQSPRNCYVCKEEYTRLHHFYDSMCPKCAEFNYQKRFQTASLKGQVALITGSRLKIGYQATLMMLRAGAHVIATTRFPKDSAVRFSREADFDQWKDRLEIHGLDLRHTPSVELFTRYIYERTARLDILINNAAQTVRRPPGFYSHMMELENTPTSQLPEDAQKLLGAHEECKRQISAAYPVESETALPTQWHGQAPGVGLRASAQLSQIPYSYDTSIVADEVFPQGRLDADLQQVDLRTTNSWRMKLADVPTPEMLEVQLVNSVAPFVLCSRLAPLMRRDYTGQKHIVNVTAMEGKFYRFHKEDRHPHTNMAKAALNMLTHTSASDLAKDGIYMNAVDTGWVTDEDPAILAQIKQDVHDFQPPLDIVDGAARVCDPFFDGILTGKHWCGKFLKDYFPIDW